LPKREFGDFSAFFKARRLYSLFFDNGALGLADILEPTFFIFLTPTKLPAPTLFEDYFELSPGLLGVLPFTLDFKSPFNDYYEINSGFALSTLSKSG